MYSYLYPRPAVTSDCVVFNFCRDDIYILLIKRGKEPFKDTWAFPGGFLDMNETLQECASRELFEETGLNIESNLLEFFCIADNVQRDPRGRVISGIFTATIKTSKVVKVQASDDASDVCWFNITEIPELAFDHFDILQNILKSKKLQ